MSHTDFPTIAFIGAGNMGGALIGGLLAHGQPPARLRVADANPAPLQKLAQQFSVYVAHNNADAVHGADAVVLAVKPQQMQAVARALRDPLADHRPLVISIAAGIRSTDLARWLGAVPIIRAMPNTPALLGCGATGLFAAATVSAAARQLAERIFAAAGLTVWLQQETQIDALTAVSGSGPAYFFYVMEAMIQAGEQLGLSAEQARALTLQTALGAARMAGAAGAPPPAQLRQNVTSPGGTTEQALQVLRESGLQQIFLQAMRACQNRGAELAEQFGQDQS